MPSSKSDERIMAEQIYCKNKGSIKLVEIAEQLGVSPSKIRKWKSLDAWDSKSSATTDTRKKQVERSTSRKGSVPPDNTPQKAKKRGPPKGNKNAVGNSGGAPLRNKNSEKHGIYANPFADLLVGADQDVFNGAVDSSDEEKHLNEEIALLTVRERWLIQKIQQIQQQSAVTRGLIINNVNRSETKREFDGTADEKTEDQRLYRDRQRAKVDASEKLPGRDVHISTTTVESSDLLLRAHAELTRVQSQKTRCIEALNKIRQSRGDSNGNSIANDWIKSLTGDDAEDE